MLIFSKGSKSHRQKFSRVLRASKSGAALEYTMHVCLARVSPTSDYIESGLPYIVQTSCSPFHLPFCSPPSMAPENGTLRGSCLCESVKFELKGEPTGLGKFICHCKHCKKASGSTYMANWFFDKKVTIPHHPDALIRSPLTDRDRHTPHFTAKRMSPLTRTTDLTLAGY